jgi:iron complex outermembrane receptor protein
VEAGADLYVGDAMTLRMTRFDQLADGLIQRVTIVVDSTEDRPRDRIGYVVQNVGEIENDGWELQATLARGGLSLSGALTLVDSRVRRLALGYGGDLRRGDRMLEVPARTLGVVAAWTDERWSAAVAAQRAFDWIGYDRVALARAVVSDSVAVEELVGRRLREFWIHYDGSTRLRATATAALRPGLEARLILDNLLDRQRGEPDNVSIVPGRTVGVGVRVAF